MILCESSGPAVGSALDDRRVRSCERGGSLCDLLSPLAQRIRGCGSEAPAELLL